MESTEHIQILKELYAFLKDFSKYECKEVMSISVHTPVIQWYNGYQSNFPGY